MELTIQQLKEKYSRIEEKIPSQWKSFEKAGTELAQDICFLWDISDSELIRVIALVEMRAPGLKISQHIDNRFAVCGLYPHIQKAYNIEPE